LSAIVTIAIAGYSWLFVKQRSGQDLY